MDGSDVSSVPPAGCVGNAYLAFCQVQGAPEKGLGA